MESMFAALLEILKAPLRPDRWPALRALRGGQPGLLKGQEALEICIPPEPGLVRVAYRTDPIQISSILSELADLLSVQERAD